jgi:hypothetical protein
MIPKPEPRRKVKARTARQQAAARAACVVAVWKRTDHCCEFCGRWVKRPREATSALEIGHVHELVPRSLGGDPTDPNGCVLVCAFCHEAIHAKRLKVPHASQIR